MVGKGLGAKPAGLAEDTMAPTVWATMATVANKLLVVQTGSLQRKKMEEMINESNQKFIQYIEVLLNQQKRSIDPDVANGNLGINTLQAFVNESTLPSNKKLDIEVQDLHPKLGKSGKRSWVDELNKRTRLRALPQKPLKQKGLPKVTMTQGISIQKCGSWPLRALLTGWRTRCKRSAQRRIQQR
jgi:hypothetical protein